MLGGNTTRMNNDTKQDFNLFIRYLAEKDSNMSPLASYFNVTCNVTNPFTQRGEKPGKLMSIKHNSPGDPER